MDNGFIVLHRKMLDNPISKKPHWAWLWVYLLMRANWEDKETIWNGKKTTIPKGSFITGRLRLSKETGIKASTIERALEYLENEHQIEQQKNNKYRVITIVNWNKYQNKDNKTDNKRTASGQLADTDNNNNNNNNNNKEHMSATADAFEVFWSKYPKKEQKKKSYEVWKRKKLDDYLPAIIEFIDKAVDTDRWKKGFVKIPTTFLNGECWNDDLSSYMDTKHFISAPESITIR